MTPSDLRNENWERLQDGLQGRLLDVYRIWREYGPGTTRAVALRSGREILSLRPRTTDLYGIGLVELVGRVAGDGGVYRARDREEWESWRERQVGVGCQVLMKI